MLRSLVEPGAQFVIVIEYPRVRMVDRYIFASQRI